MELHLISQLIKVPMLCHNYVYGFSRLPRQSKDGRITFGGTIKSTEKQKVPGELWVHWAAPLVGPHC